MRYILADQVSKEPSKEGGKGTETNVPSDAPPTASKLAVPAVSSLLEFVAWMALQSLPGGGTDPPCSFLKLANWLVGRGGYLADELDAVHEASIRQVIAHITAGAS